MAALAHSIVKKLEELVQYQEGVFVSRTIIGKKTGTITLFAFDEEQQLSEHTAPYDALVHVLDGTVEIIISGDVNVLNAGDIIILPANVPHAVNALSKFKMLLTMIKS